MTAPGEAAPGLAPTVLTVSQLVLRAANALVAEFGTVAVQGELSGLRYIARSGHMYWTLKDSASEVSCAMFRRDNERLTAPLADGMHVVVVGQPTVYSQRGQFQLVVSQVVPQGRGALYAAFEALKARLAAEGLFDAERKRPLPLWPRRVGVLTSATGAAVRDIITVIHRRAPGTWIVLKPVAVQGREAAPEIARGIRWFATRPELADVLIVGRGGGSLEDLWAFNEEVVVRAIVESPIPVISAVGHETDTTLADYAADLRAPTPSAAAERAVPETRAIARTTLGLWRRLTRAVERQRLRRLDEALAPIKRYGFRRVRDRLRETHQRLDDSAGGLAPAVAGRLDGGRVRLRSAAAALPDRPAENLTACARRLDGARGMPRALARRHERVRTRHHHLVERLEAANPLAILARGYAVVTGPDGAVARDATRLAAGDPLAIRLARGRVAALVTATEPPSEEV